MYYVKLMLTEDSNLYRGIFWIPDVNNVEQSQLYFQIPCNSNGDIDTDFEIFKNERKNYIIERQRAIANLVYENFKLAKVIIQKNN